MNDRNARGLEIGEDMPNVRLDELDVVGRRERAHPRIEQLHDLRARVDLGPQVAAHHFGQLVHEAMKQLGLAVHMRLVRA